MGDASNHIIGVNVWLDDENAVSHFQGERFQHVVVGSVTMLGEHAGPFRALAAAAQKAVEALEPTATARATCYAVCAPHGGPVRAIDVDTERDKFAHPYCQRHLLDIAAWPDCLRIADSETGDVIFERAEREAETDACGDEPAVERPWPEDSDLAAGQHGCDFLAHSGDFPCIGDVRLYRVWMSGLDRRYRWLCRDAARSLGAWPEPSMTAATV